MLPFSVAQEPIAGGSRQNAFEVLMSAQQQLSHKSMPDLISEPKTKKQTLMNDVITFLRENDCQWPSNEVSSLGMSLVNALTDTLWTIDGHHHVFASQGNQIGGPGLWDTIDLNSRSIRNVEQATCLLQCFSHCHRICSTTCRAATGTDLAG